jgi:hypothetical protein
MAADKIVFVAFAIEDQAQRTLLVGQSVHAKAPFEFIDMSVKEPYQSDWKDKVRTRIKRSHGVIAMISKNSPKSTGELWEIQCAREEKKKMIGLKINSSDNTTLPQLAGYKTIAWTWEGIADFIDGL